MFEYVAVILTFTTIVAIICAFLSSNLACKKGYLWNAWFLCGFFFGILGLIAAAGLPSKTYGLDDQTKKCAEMVRTEALVCRYCGHRFDESDIAKVTK